MNDKRVTMNDLGPCGRFLWSFHCRPGINARRQSAPKGSSRQTNLLPDTVNLQFIDITIFERLLNDLKEYEDENCTLYNNGFICGTDGL